MTQRTPRSTLFPYTTLFRSGKTQPLVHDVINLDDLFAEIEDVLQRGGEDRKSTRLNSSHTVISYAVFCLKKKKPWLAYGGLHDQQVQRTGKGLGDVVEAVAQ